MLHEQCNDEAAPSCTQKLYQLKQVAIPNLKAVPCKVHAKGWPLCNPTCRAPQPVLKGPADEGLHLLPNRNGGLALAAIGLVLLAGAQLLQTGGIAPQQIARAQWFKQGMPCRESILGSTACCTACCTAWGALLPIALVNMRGWRLNARAQAPRHAPFVAVLVGSPQGHDGVGRPMPCFAVPCSMLVKQQAAFNKTGTLHTKAAYIVHATLPQWLLGAALAPPPQRPGAHSWPA